MIFRSDKNNHDKQKQVPVTLTTPSVCGEVQQVLPYSD